MYDTFVHQLVSDKQGVSHTKSLCPDSIYLYLESYVPESCLQEETCRSSSIHHHAVLSLAFNVPQYGEPDLAEAMTVRCGASFSETVQQVSGPKLDEVFSYMKTGSWTSIAEVTFLFSTYFSARLASVFGQITQIPHLMLGDSWTHAYV